MEDRFIIRILLLFISITCLCACGDLENPKERNKLAFNDSIPSVVDSINVMEKILIESKGGKFTYVIDVETIGEKEHFFYISDDELHSIQRVGSVTDSLLYKNKALEFIDSLKRKRFVNLALFLNKNYLSCCNIENGKLIYMYRSDIFMADSQTDLNRYVVFANSEAEIDLTKYKILDRHNHLYLLANKEAKIWSSE